MRKQLLLTIVSTILVVSLINLASAVTLDTGTVLTTSVSNSSLTFTIPITVDSIVIETNNITLTNIVCTGDLVEDFTNVIWITTNTNLDSSSYCTQYESDRNNICASLGLGIDNVSSKLPIVFTIAGVILLLGILGIAWVVYQGGTGIGIDVNLNLIIALVMGVVGLIVVSIIALVITSTVCSI